MAKIDTFTKILLVVIAIFIGMIALKPILSTEVAQANPGQFNNLDLEILGSPGSYGAFFFDRSTGKGWNLKGEGATNNVRRTYENKLKPLLFRE